MNPVEFKNKKAVVAGASGFIGSNLVRRLLEEGCALRGILHNRPAAVEDKRIEYVHADLTTMEGCRRAVEGMEFLFMCAAQTAGAGVMASDPLSQVTPNILINTQLLQAAYLAKVQRVLFISSSAAYPPTGAIPVKEHQMFEGDPFEAYYSVGWMKRMAEVLCKIYSQKIKDPMPVAVVRPSNAYGPGDKFDFKTSHVTAALIRRVAERQKPFEVWGDGSDVRDLIYVDDLIDGVIKVFKTFDVYTAVNLALGRGYTVKQVLETLLEIDGFKDADIRYIKDKPRMIPERFIDTALAREQFGFTAAHSLREGLSKTLLWYHKTHDSASR